MQTSALALTVDHVIILDLNVQGAVSRGLVAQRLYTVARKSTFSPALCSVPSGLLVNIAWHHLSPNALQQRGAKRGGCDYSSDPGEI